MPLPEIFIKSRVLLFCDGIRKPSTFPQPECRGGGNPPGANTWSGYLSWFSPTKKTCFHKMTGAPARTYHHLCWVFILGYPLWGLLSSTTTMIPQPSMFPVGFVPLIAALLLWENWAHIIGNFRNLAIEFVSTLIAIIIRICSEAGNSLDLKIRLWLYRWYGSWLKSCTTWDV